MSEWTRINKSIDGENITLLFLYCILGTDISNQNMHLPTLAQKCINGESQQERLGSSKIPLSKDKSKEKN